MDTKREEGGEEKLQDEISSPHLTSRNLRICFFTLKLLNIHSTSEREPRNFTLYLLGVMYLLEFYSWRGKKLLGFKEPQARSGGVGDYLHVAFIEVNSLHFMAYPKAERGYNS